MVCFALASDRAPLASFISLIALSTSVFVVAASYFDCAEICLLSAG